METKINIAEILRNKPHGIKLYSPIFGECSFCYVREDTNDICVKKHNGVIEYFNYEGLYFAHGEVMLFPSKEMRDWSKFFNKGDVMVCYEGKKPYYTIFDCFESNTYKGFNGKFSYDSYEDKWYQNEGNLSTNTFHKLSLADSEIYITKIEERFGGKLNIETFEIEKAHPEFKDGDIVFVESHMLGINTSSIITTIFRKDKENDKYKFSPALCESNVHDTYFREFPIVLSTSDIKTFRLATEEEKKQFFSALEKEGKRWNSDKKAIVDLKPKWTPKTFDKVITRVHNKAIWTANIFSHIDQHGKYVTIGCISGYTYCIPYNDETAKLIGTTNKL